MKENTGSQCPAEGPQDSTSEKLITLREDTLNLLIAHLVELPYEKVQPLLAYLQAELETPEPSIIVK